MKRLLVKIVLVWFFGLSVFAQTDTEFWFVAPEVTTNHYDYQLNTEFNTTYRGGEPQLLRFTTKNLPADITIEQPANLINFPPITFSLPANSSQTINLTDLGLSSEVENSIRRNGNSPYNNKGFHITSSNPITVYYEVSTRNNADIFALKGDNALGEEFLVPFQNQGRNQRDNWSENASNDGKAYSAADIVATEDGTNITINSPVEIYADQFNAVWPANTDLNITLDRGETFSLAPAWDLGDNWFGREGNDHMGGTTVKVTNGKKIAITKKDDSVKDPSAGCYDLIGDQLVPNDILGLEYIAMRGQLNNPLERVYVYPVENGTQLWVDGNVGVPDDIIDRNSPYIYEFDGTSPDYVHFRADKKVVVLHVSGFGCEMGGAILPPTDKCTGSTEVGFTRATSEGFYINIMVRNGAEDGFLYNGAAPTFFSDADFQPITGTGDWLAARIGPLTTGQVPFKVSQLISNTKDVFHLGIINGGSSTGCRFGYFSDFNELRVNAEASGSSSQNIRACFGEPIQLVASGGTQFEWSPKTYLDDPYSATPIATPPASQKYVVTVSGACGLTDSSDVTLQISTPIEAIFTADTTFGCSPLTVTFNDKSTGVREFYWNFNNTNIDGNVDTDYWVKDEDLYTDTTFSHTFVNTSNSPTDSAQTYEVQLLVKNVNDCTDTLRRYITVYPAVSSNFTLTDLNDTLACQPEVANFQNLSTNTHSWVWDFGDGGSSSQQNPSHTFYNSGTVDSLYTVRLVSTSNFLCRDTSYQQFRIHPYIKASFSIDTVVNCAPFDVNFNNNAEGAITSYNWDFSGDGAYDYFGSEAVISRSYNNAGIEPDTIAIKLMVENAAGCQNTMTRDIVVIPQNITDFDVNVFEGCDSVRIEFTDNSQGYQLDYDWDFGDGGSSGVENPDHIFVNKNDTDTTYTVTLTTSSIAGYCPDQKSVDIRVYPIVEADFKMKYAEICAPIVIDLPNTSYGGGDNFIWEIDALGAAYNAYDADSTQTVIDTLRWTFDNPEANIPLEYTVSLIAEDTDYGCNDTLTRRVKVYPKVVSHFAIKAGSVDAGCSPHNVTFTNSSTGGSLVYDWNFDDGTFDNDGLGDLTHSFVNRNPATSVHEVVLTATNPDGCVDRDTIVITAYPEIEANFAFDYVSDKCTPFELEFENNSLNGNQFKWDYGFDGNSDTRNNKNNFVYEFDSSDPNNVVQYTLKLVANDTITGCKDSTTKVLDVFPRVIAGFDIDTMQGCNPLPVQFTNLSTGSSTYSWDFKDQTNSNKVNPLHEFENREVNDKTFDVVLTAENNNGCTDEADTTITVYPYVNADFAISNDGGCSPFTVELTNSSVSNVQNIWDFGDNTSSTDADPDPVTYTNASNPLQVYNRDIKLIVKNSHDCADSITRTVQVYPRSIPEFDATLEGCHPLIVDFTNQTTDDSNSDYFWKFGASSNSVRTNPTYTFDNRSHETDTAYSVTLVSTTQYDCADSITKTVIVHPKPLAQMNIAQTISCPPFDIDVENISEGTDLTYYFDYGDGDEETLTTMDNVTHQYLNDGTLIDQFNVQLIAETEFDCVDTAVTPIFVYPNVIAAFDYDTSGCSPHIIQFENQSTSTATYHDWDFDDDLFSSLENPQHRFVNSETEDKTFMVELRSESLFGCYDVVTHPVTVFPAPIAEFSIDDEFRLYPDATFEFINATNEGNWTYEWDFGDGNTSGRDDRLFEYTYDYWAPNDEDNQYEVVLRAYSDKCSDVVVHNITLLAASPSVIIENPINADCTPFTVDFSTFTQYENDIQWNFDDGSTSDEYNPRHTFYDPGTYNISVSVSGDGGEDIDYATVTVYPLPEVNFKLEPGYVLLEGGQAEVRFFNTTQRGETYLWNFGDQNTSADVDPIHFYAEEGVYTVYLTAWTEYGCADSITKVNAVEVDGSGVVDFPNAFIPNETGPNGGEYSNSDTRNEVFHPVHEQVKEYELRIFNRWGEVLFISNDINIGWDGYYKGKPVPPGVYAWQVRGKYENGKPFVKAGDVTVIR